MNNLRGQRSKIGGAIGEEINRLHDLVGSLFPYGGPYLRPDHTTRGINWQPTPKLLGLLQSAVVHKAQITTVNETTLTCTDIDTAETITVSRPDELKSYAATRSTPSDPDNWLPADGDTSGSGASFNYANDNYRLRIIHISDPSIDYLTHIERIDPLYVANDYIYVYKDNDTWVDLNVAGRHWRQVFTHDYTHSVNTANAMFHNQANDHLYATSNPAWLTATDYSSWDQY